ncbi:MAG: hypothetical protein AB8B81_11510 [Halioglobus sp.]
MSLSTASAHPGMETRLAQLAKLIESNPRQQALFVLRAGMYSQEGDWQRAREDLERAQRLGDPVEADYELGLLHYRRGEYWEARSALKRYLLKYPHHEQALLYRARAARDLGLAEAARLDFINYIASAEAPHPGDVIAAAKLVAAQSETALSDALQLLDAAMSRVGNQGQLQRFAITLELQRGEVSLAVNRFKKLEPSLGSNPHWKVEMARLLLQDKRNIEASALLNEAKIQLDQLRTTPARQALTLEIEKLKLSQG